MIYIDANIMLEIIEKRQRAAACERLLASNTEIKAISILTLDLVMYLAEKHKLEVGPLEAFLRGLAWLPIIEADAHWAFTHFMGKDFEDALQISCARREGCTKFVTLDQKLAKKYASELQIELIR